MRHLLAALAVLALTLAVLAPTYAPTPQAPTQADVPLSMADYPAPTPAPATPEGTCWAACVLTWADVEVSAQTLGREPAYSQTTGAPICYEDELLVSAWSGSGHHHHVCLALDDMVQPMG